MENTKVIDVITNSDTYAKKICDLIKIVVAEYYKLPISVYQSRSRKRSAVRVRQTAVYFIRMALPRVTLNYIGWQIGYNHATVLYCLRNIKNLAETENETRIDLKDIARILQIEQTASNLIDGDIEKEYYYINMHACTSIKLGTGKALVVVGFTDDELKRFISTNALEQTPVKHKDTGLYILKRKQQDETN
jgi:hypothetical protein